MTCTDACFETEPGIVYDEDGEATLVCAYHVVPIEFDLEALRRAEPPPSRWRDAMVG